MKSILPIGEPYIGYRKWLLASGETWMSSISSSNFLPPWGTKGSLNRIGEKLRSDADISQAEVACLDSWRAAHKHVMNAFQSMLRGRTRGKSISVAQRHKRRLTIVDKLTREPRMQLARMDDVAGIRLIFPDIKSMHDFRNSFLSSKHKHTRKSTNDKYNYILYPKDTGYRGIHDIYTYYSDSKSCSVANGLMIEVQFRTSAQHAWATANEIITMTTDNRTKFNSGDTRYLEFFRLSSEIIARTAEQKNSVYPELTDEQLVNAFRELENEIHIARFLAGLSGAYVNYSPSGSLILQFTSDSKLLIHNVPRFVSAHEVYFKLEKDNPEDDIVLVSAETFDQMRSAYRNYFSDSEEFLTYLNQGIATLEGANVSSEIER